MADRVTWRTRQSLERSVYRSSCWEVWKAPYLTVITVNATHRKWLVGPWQSRTLSKIKIIYVWILIFKSLLGKLRTKSTVGQMITSVPASWKGITLTFKLQMKGRTYKMLGIQWEFHLQKVILVVWWQLKKRGIKKLKRNEISRRATNQHGGFGKGEVKEETKEEIALKDSWARRKKKKRIWWAHR